MLVQLTSNLCPFHISKNIFWVQVHFNMHNTYTRFDFVYYLQVQFIVARCHRAHVCDNSVGRSAGRRSSNVISPRHRSIAVYRLQIYRS